MYVDVHTRSTQHSVRGFYILLINISNDELRRTDSLTFLLLAKSKLRYCLKLPLFPVFLIVIVCLPPAQCWKCLLQCILIKLNDYERERKERIYVCVCVHVYEYLYGFMCVYVWACTLAHVSLCVRECVPVSIHVCNVSDLFPLLTVSILQLKTQKFLDSGIASSGF